MSGVIEAIRAGEYSTEPQGTRLDRSTICHAASMPRDGGRAPKGPSTPDGREWLVSIEGRKRSMKETREQPFFWAHVIVTAIIAAVMIYIFRHNTGILWILVVATVVIWAVGFVGATFAAMIRAETKGPPPEHRLWKVTKRSARKQAAAGRGRGDRPGRPDRRAAEHAPRRDLSPKFPASIRRMPRTDRALRRGVGIPDPPTSRSPTTELSAAGTARARTVPRLATG